MTTTISLLPLSPEYHTAALQQVYHATPGYWQLYGLPGSPADQAARDLQTAAETPGRYLMGIVRRLVADDPTAGVELIGFIDFRLAWPDPDIVYIGMVMVAEPYQRNGIGQQAWHLLQPWLATTAQMSKARLGIEQFNPHALQFFEQIGFQLTGASERVKIGDKFVRLLYMEKTL
ncbi:MAG: GNAT family N-acetyltransferase [Chloroflexi bacterium]|nr:GNAT family N-acetyltransferase [Chloroflexota bacterium]